MFYSDDHIKWFCTLRFHLSVLSLTLTGHVLTPIQIGPVVLFILGTVGNVWTLIIMRTWDLGRRSNNMQIYMIFLAISDLLVLYRSVSFLFHRLSYSAVVVVIVVVVTFVVAVTVFIVCAQQLKMANAVLWYRKSKAQVTNNNKIGFTTLRV